MVYYRGIIRPIDTVWCLIYYYLIFCVGFKCEAFVAIPLSLFIYPPELGGPPMHLRIAASHIRYCPNLAFSPSKGRSESFNEQQLRSLKEEILTKKAEFEKEMKVLERLKQTADPDKPYNESIRNLSNGARRRNSPFLDGLSTHVLQGGNGAMGLKALALRNGMNSTEADTYVVQVKYVLHLLELAENIPALREEKNGYSNWWLSNETPAIITSSCQSFCKIESMWIEALRANDTRMMVLVEELWDMLTTQAYSELLDYGLGLGVPYQDGATLATWAEKALSNTQEGEVMWTNISSETTKNIFIKAAAYVLGGLSICTRLNFRPAFNEIPESEGFDFLNIPSPSSEPPPYHDVFNPSDNELSFKQQFGIKRTARLKLGIPLQKRKGNNIPPDTFTHSEASQGNSTTILNISKRKCPRETLLGLLAVETACLAYGASALLNATNESWLEGKPTEAIAVEALEACMMRPTVSNVLHRLGIKPLEMDKKEYLNVSTCSPDDVHLFRRNILRDDLFEPFPKAVPFNESPAASIDLSEIAYSELSPGTCSTGDTMPCLGIVVFKGRWKFTPEEINAKLRKRLEGDSTGLNDRVEVLFWSDEFFRGIGGYGTATRASTIRGWISWAMAKIETALLKDATLAIEMRRDLSDALESIEDALRSRAHSRYTAILIPKPFELQGPPKIPFGLAVGTTAVTLGAFCCGMQSIPAAYAPTMLAVMASIQAVHELGHVLVAKRNGFDKAVPNILPIPSPTLGISGTALWPRGMTSSQDAEYDMYMAGPIAGFLAACTALLAGVFLEGGSGKAVGLPVNIVQSSWLVSKFLDFAHPGLNILTDMASNPLHLHPLAAGGIAALHMQALQGLCVVGSDISAARNVISRSLEKGENFKQTFAFNLLSGSLPLIGNCAALYAALLKHNWVPLWYTITLSAIVENDEWGRSRCRSDVGLTNITTKFSALALFHIICVLLIIPISTSSFLGGSGGT